MFEIISGIAVGAAFGFVLDRIGATNPDYIIRMLNLTDLHLMKTILMGIGVASVLVFGGLIAGFVDVGHLSVKTTHLGVLTGGLLLGLGFAVSGYCPGTGLTAAATGRIDAMFFVVGGLIGAAVYMVAHARISATGILDDIAGGKTTVGLVDGSNYPAILNAFSGEWVGVVLGILLIVVSWLLPRRIGKQRDHRVLPVE